MAKVLLTGVIGPHSNILFDLVGDRLTRDQDILTFTSHAHSQALHFIAHNLSAETVVLEHPLEGELIAELEKGYDFAGINFTMVNIAKTFYMCETIKKHAPDTKIVLGGYGTACLNTIFQSDEEIYEIDPLICPKCEGEMRVISVIEDQVVIKKILQHLGIWETRSHDPPACETPYGVLTCPLTYHRTSAMRVNVHYPSLEHPKG